MVASVVCPGCKKHTTTQYPHCVGCGASLAARKPATSSGAKQRGLLAPLSDHTEPDSHMGLVLGAVGLIAVVSLVAWILLSGRGLPKEYTIGGARIEVVGRGWSSRGDLILVRGMRCPWNEEALAAFKVRRGDPHATCLIFRENEVREAFPKGGSLPIATEKFKWADGWPSQLD